MQNYQKNIAIQNIATLKSFNRCFSLFISTLFFGNGTLFFIFLFHFGQKDVSIPFFIVTFACSTFFCTQGPSINKKIEIWK
jgi:hypothetical protein